MNRGLGAAILAPLLVLFLLGPATDAQQPPAPRMPAESPAAQQPAQPFAPDWAMFAGGDVFAKKGCGKCHAIRGFGGGVGPDLARIRTGKTFYDLGADMWNHLPRMGARMRQAGIERPALTGPEVSNVIAFLFTLQYFDELGDANVGASLFTSKGCVQCHEVGGKGGRVGPPLDALKRSNSPILVAAAMWDHGPRMAEVMQSKGIPRPTFRDDDLVNIIAYIVSASKDTSTETTQVVPGTPDRGQKLFTEKQCVVCHAVAGKGGHVGPDLGRSGHLLSLTRFAADMWDHGPAMWARMKERGIQVPVLTGQDMADIVAYLYVSHYFDQAGNARHGAELIASKRCLTCHSVQGKGGKIAADFATSRVVRTPGQLIAGMWNHSSYMEAETRKQEVAWPVLTGQDLADISAYLTSLLKAPAAPSRPR